MNHPGRTILVVDDEDGLRESIAFDFRRRKFNVLTANCGRDALSLVKANKVDVVLSDVRMPNGSGLELLDWIKSNDVSLPVLMFITAYADISVAEAYDRGADAVFSKPFDRAALNDAVLRAIETLDQPLRRSGTRVPTEISIALQFPEFAIKCLVKNLGRGGVFVECAGPMPKTGNVAEFRLTTEDPNVDVRGEAVVRWVREQATREGPAGFGMEFVDFRPESREKMMGIINFLKTKSYIPLK